MCIWMIYFVSCIGGGGEIEGGLKQLAQRKGNKKLCKCVVRITLHSHLPK